MRPAGELPPARFGHTLVFDSRRQRLLLFGGQASGFFNDTWAFDLQSSRWNRLAESSGAPSRRYGHSAIYDAARDRMIVSHGFTDSGRFDDTWALDLAANTWRDISPPSGRPLRRCLHHAVYDAERAQMLLYGGCASGFGPCPLGDLWSFDLTTQRWSEVTTQARPPAREHYGLGFDSVRGRMLLFGGSGNALLDDTWEFDPRERLWREATISGPRPSARSRHQGVFAEGRGVTFFFGGSTASASTNELWMLGPAFILPPRPAFSLDGISNAFSGAAGGPVAPGELIALRGTDLVSAGGGDPSVTFNGTSAPVLFASPEQVNVQVPYEVQGSNSAAIQLIANGQASDNLIAPVAETRPGLFPVSYHADGATITADSPAVPGEIAVFYATGSGITSPPVATGALPESGVTYQPVAAVTLTIGSSDAEIIAAALAPGLTGVLRIEARIPALRAGTAAVLLRSGSAQSQPGVNIEVVEGGVQ